MEQYTRLSKAEIESLAAKFGIYELTSFKLLSGGSENTNYLINAEKGKYVCSICEQKSPEKVKELVHLLEHLNQNHFRTSKIVYTQKKEPILVWEGKPIMVKHFIEGGIQKDLPPHLLKSIGQELGKLHQIEAPEYLPKELGYGKEQFGNVKQYAAHSPFDLWLTEIEAYLAPFFQLDLPKSFIHSDLFWNNVIVNEAEDAVTVLDFEEAGYYYRIFDIGMTIIGVCAEEKMVNLEKVGHLLAGYQEEVQLLEKEIHALKAFTIYAGAAMTFWRHQNFHHIKPDPLFFDHYLGLKVLVDDLLEREEDCFSRLFEK